MVIVNEFIIRIKLFSLLKLLEAINKIIPNSISKDDLSKSFGLPSSIKIIGTNKKDIPRTRFSIPKTICKIKMCLLNYS